MEKWEIDRMTNKPETVNEDPFFFKERTVFITKNMEGSLLQECLRISMTMVN